MVSRTTRSALPGLILTSALLTLCLFASSRVAAQATGPNLVFIIADDK